MDTTKSEPTLEESIKQVMQTLPPAIRTYLAEGKYTPVAKNLMTKYMLRIDQGGVLEREIMLLLMGIDTPEEFTKALTEEAKLTPQAVSGVVQDVNAQVFIPLREEMKKSAGNATQQPKPTVSAGGVAVPARFFHLENKIAPKQTAPQAPSLFARQPTMQPAVVAKPSTLAQAIGSALNTQPKAMPQVPVSQSSSTIAPLPPKIVLPRPGVFSRNQIPTNTRKLLEDHEEPRIEFKKTEMPPAPVPPKAESQVPPNLPGAMPPVPVPVMQGAPSVPEVHALPVEPKPIPPPAPMPAPVKSYSVDPYREPIE